MHRSEHSPTARVALTALASVLVVMLAGCAPDEPIDPLEPTPTVSLAPSPETSAPPALVPDGSATDNLPYFTAVVDGVWATDAREQGRAYIDALTAAGFDRAAMQVTNDRSTVDNAAESIQFSVRWGEECLVGQVGPATGDPFTTVVPVLPTGTCLLGKTRPIDW